MPDIYPAADLTAIREGLAFVTAADGQWTLTITDPSRRRRLHGPKTFLWASYKEITLDHVARILPDEWAIAGTPPKHEPFSLIVPVERATHD